MKVSKVNDVHIFIDCDASQAAELNDYFTFEIPNAKFTPSYRSLGLRWYQISGIDL